MGQRKKRGYYSFVSTLFLPEGSRGNTFHIKQSWLPFSEENQQLALIAKHRDPNIFPALNEKSYAAIGTMLDLYAVERGLQTQSNLFRFRPHVLNEYENEGEDASITELVTRIRDRSIEDRAVIETHNQSESVHVLEELLTLIEEALKKEGITMTEDMRNARLRYRISALLASYPFLAFVIFENLPNLSILYVSGFIGGVKSTYALIRPQEGEIAIDESWSANEHIVNLIAS